jgi:hypothetical protein
VVACAGATALLAVVAWRLRASYGADVETVCDAETLSGVPLRRDMAAVADWIRARLGTPEGNAFYATLEDLPVVERSARLARAASALGIPSCPLAGAYDRLVQDGLLRADVQRLCSRATFPDLLGRASDERAAAIERWIDADAATAPVRALGPPLRAAATPQDRARVLTEAARGVDVLTCDVAKDLLAPDPADAAPE